MIATDQLEGGIEYAGIVGLANEIGDQCIENLRFDEPRELEQVGLAVVVR